MFLSKLSKLIFRRSVIIGTGIFLQFLLLVFSIWKMASQFIYIYIFLVIFSLVAVLYVVGNRTNPAYKLGWAILILSFPILGGVFYLLFGTSNISWGIKKNLMKQNNFSYEDSFTEENQEEIKKLDENIYRQLSYLVKSGFPVYKCSEAQYFPLGEDKFRVLLEELKKSERYIFMEYFIISKGKMWDSVLGILKEKVREGVEVRIIYDDCGCTQIPFDYDEQLRKMGIKCRVFNPLRPSLSITMNNRDHRKIVVIDGKVGFTGGINIADEYINEINLHGHWKDCAVMIKGQAVKTFVQLFLQMWNLIKPEDEKVCDYYGDYEITDNYDGYVVPYGVEPYNKSIGEDIYLNMINKAKNEILIYTPYLIITNELTQALILSAGSGVDITIVTPGTADKWYVHTQTRSNYLQLIEAGVKIYEYTPGFIHGKVVICDGEFASVGTINFDYRSLYLHFECGTLFYRVGIISDMKRDFSETVEKSHLISKEECENIPFRTRIVRAVLRIFSPLM